MPTYLITAPDGRKFRVSGPGSKEEALAQVQAQHRPKDEPGAIGKLGQAAARQLGLGARDLVNVATSIPALATDVILQPINLIAGRQVFQPAQQALNERLTQAGLPEPANATERITSGISRAVAGAGTSIATGAALAQSAIPATRSVGAVMAARPATQEAAAIGAGLGTEVAREADLPWWAQAGAGLAGGMIGAGGFELAKAGGRALQAMAQPFTRSGQERIVGNALADAATAPGQARQNLQGAAEIVPDSPPTTGPASRDLGLLSLERQVRNSSPGEFAEIATQQNAARATDLAKSAKTPRALQAAIDRRESVTKPIREAAFKAAQGKPVDTPAILQKIDALIADPDNAGEATQTALLRFRGAVEGKADARALYAVRKDLNRILEGKFVDSSESALRYAGGQLAQVKDFIDEGISAVAPQWRTYLGRYAQLSRPIDRLATLQQKAEAVVTAPVDPQGRHFISQAKWYQQITRQMPELEKELTKGQVARLRRIGADLDRGEMINSKAVRPMGSDTASNLSVANLVGAIRGRRGSVGAVPATLARPFEWLAKAPEPQVRQLLIEAIKDPALAARLLGKATPNNAQATAQKLLELWKASAVGATVGTAATDRRTTPEPERRTTAR